MTTLIDPPALIGTRMRVHFNLHTHLWSVTALTGPNSGRVIANVDNITLANAEFKVSAKGRDRSHRLRKRTVHAWVVGVVVSVNTDLDLSRRERVTYNPAPDRAPNFTASDGTPVLHADYADFSATPDNPTRGYAWI